MLHMIELDLDIPIGIFASAVNLFQQLCLAWDYLLPTAIFL